MDKKTAIDLLGGTIPAAANSLGTSYQAVKKWPDPLSPRIADRVIAHLARTKLTQKAMDKLTKQSGDSPAPVTPRPLADTAVVRPAVAARAA